jgi:hypothetical protein
MPPSSGTRWSTDAPLSTAYQTGLQAADLVGRLVVAGAFGLAAALKLADLPGLRTTLYLSRITRPWVPQLTVALPVIELGCAAGLLGVRSGWPASVLAVMVLLAFIAFLAADRTAGEGCNCFGRRSGTSRRAGIVRDVVLIAALAPALLRGPAGARWGIPSGTEPGAGVAAVIAVAVLLVWAFRRDRRLRRATVERGRRRAGRPATAALPPSGRVAPDFDLPDLAGGRLRLADVLAGAQPAGSWTPVVFVEPECSACAGPLGRLADRTTVLLVASGDRAEVTALAQRYRLTGWSRVAVDLDGAVADAYRVRSTPSACLLDPHGVFRDAAGVPTERLAVGPDAVTALIEAATRAR